MHNYANKYSMSLSKTKHCHDQSSYDARITTTWHRQEAIEDLASWMMQESSRHIMQTCFARIRPLLPRGNQFANAMRLPCDILMYICHIVTHIPNKQYYTCFISQNKKNCSSSNPMTYIYISYNNSRPTFPEFVWTRDDVELKTLVSE